MRLIVRPEAEADLLQAFSWYEDQQPGLGRAFNDEFGGAICPFQ